MSAVADALERADHIARLERAVLPVDGEAAVGEIEARFHDAGNSLQAAFDLADAAGTADALDGEVEMRQATVALHERRKIKSFQHDGLSSQENTVLGAKHSR